MTSMDDRRDEPRVRIGCALWALRDGGRSALRVLDLSCSGARIHVRAEVASELFRGELCSVELRLGATRVLTLARLRWIGTEEIGLRFVGLHDVERLAIAEHLDRTLHRRVRLLGEARARAA
jgi:hypothetical protein